MATWGSRSMRQQHKAINKRSSDEIQTTDPACRCRAGKTNLCQYGQKSPKKVKLRIGKTTDDLIDKPEATLVTAAIPEVGGSRFASRFWDVNFNEYFSKNFKKGLEVKPRGWCYKINCFKEKIWAPIGNRIKVYNTTGTNLKTIRINNSKSVESAINGDIFIACYIKSGLYVMDDTEAPHKICEGSFADVYAYRDKVYALECEKKQLIVFCCRPDVDNVKQRWKKEKVWRVDEVYDCDRLIVTGDADLQLYVSHWNRHKISQYNAQGQFVKQFGSSQEKGDGNLIYPWLCGVDRQSNLLVADQGNNMYKVLDPGTGQWRSTGVKGEFMVYDATLDDDGNLWPSQHNGKDFTITKHEPQ